MRVTNKDDRPNSPEECDNCGEVTELTRYEHYGPGYNVDWLCCYCSRDFTHGESSVVKTVAAMLHEFERRIKRD